MIATCVLVGSVVERLVDPRRGGGADVARQLQRIGEAPLLCAPPLPAINSPAPVAMIAVQTSTRGWRKSRSDYPLRPRGSLNPAARSYGCRRQSLVREPCFVNTSVPFES
jgi:hypothetical protein